MIIDGPLWEAVQARLASRAGKSGKGRPASGEALSLSPRTTHPLSGLLTCGDCGAPMVISGGSSASYYKCNGFKKRAQAAAHKATIERLKAVPSEALVLPHPALMVQRALNLQVMFKRDPVAGREALRRLLGGQSVALRPDPAGCYVAEATHFPLLSLDREGSGNVRGTEDGCAGAIRRPQANRHGSDPQTKRAGGSTSLSWAAAHRLPKPSRSTSTHVDPRREASEPISPSVSRRCRRRGTTLFS